jgi:transcriptional regulator with XRE-family HTH domain
MLSEAGIRMTLPRELDPSSSVLAYFGAELRRHREAAGLSQERLAKLITYSAGLVGLIETARRTPSRDFAERCDAALETDGVLLRLWPLVHRGAFPEWVRNFVELEATASAIRSFECQLIPGLLQTEDYARAVLRVRPSRFSPAQLDEAVAARLSRQSILNEPSSPLAWFILDEAILRRPIGNAATMRAQLTRLLEVGDSPHVFVQVVPFTVGEYPGLDGGLTILSFDERPDIGYLEGHGGSAVLIESPDQVAECSLAYDMTRAVALSPKLSADMIRAAMEDYS